MDAEFLKSLINTVVFLLPVMGLIWKGVIPNDFEYEIITDSSEKYMVHSYVCDVDKIIVN